MLCSCPHITNGIQNGLDSYSYDSLRYKYSFLYIINDYEQNIVHRLRNIKIKNITKIKIL